VIRAFDAAGEDLIPHSQPSVRRKLQFLLPVQAEIERARQTAAPEHPLGGHGLRQTNESQRYMTGDCLHGPADAESELALRVADKDGTRRHRVAEVRGDPAKGHDPDQKSGPAKQGKRFD